MVHLDIRRASPDDAEELCELLNEIIEAGGTTALETPLSIEELTDWFIAGESALTCHVAQAGASIAGFQFLSLYENLPEGWADIGTFSRMSPKIRGVGTALFAATLSAAEELSIEFINATIRADNTGGLAYYEKMGFRTYRTLENIPLRDGTLVDRIQKRYPVKKI
ncbi:GNAT family N-acetyltransferase [Rhizobium sp. P32RR-XVIII]|uniref:GNAT family N-acetyltransferase n=1 Tax=Rhizobium sp. P32RR-XVIII TaxID=2726738 RepID=UPI001456CE58|nr:GNAT family N-acetyltransferase [Rhizobium sp. P32RR-XVIII]NLS05551.1 GNAT family N-acetyltransferase [Rhizobium sp. P32RR-XVIII]